MSKKRGKDAKLYYLSTGSRAAWPASGAPDNLTEITNCRDLKIAFDKTEIDASTRESDYETILTGLKKAPLEFGMVYDTSDTAYQAIRDAFFDDTMIAMAVLDGDADTAGTQGFWADWEILKFEEDEALEGAYLVNVSAKPSGRSSVVSARITVGT